MTPDGYTIQELMLDVGDGHQLYVHDWGNKDAKSTVLYIHPGPGSGCSNKYKMLFDPEKQRVIFFDQRGCGRSLPYSSLEHNTTKELVEDIETILDHFKLEKAILTGGSWGSALSLFFAVAHPSRVAVLVLDGIWTCRKSENDWVDKGGFRTFLPDVWASYAASVPKKFSDDPSRYHFPRILGDDPVAIKESGYAYSNLEGATVALDDRFVPEEFETFDPSSIRIEVYYLTNQGFVPDGYIIDNAHKLTMPVWLVQGRQDMVCPPVTAYELHQKLPNGNLIWTTSGHKAERESWNVKRTILLQLSKGI